MRISDWSSDVCSSDLVGKPEGGGNIGHVAALLHQPGERLPLRHFVGVQPSEVFDHRRLDGGGVVGFGEDAARQWFGLARLLRDDPRGMEAPRARDDLIVAVLTIGTHQQRRSEEHTSELQSLMRISYAVFCLKKKNKQKHK